MKRKGGTANHGLQGLLSQARAAPASQAAKSVIQSPSLFGIPEPWVDDSGFFHFPFQDLALETHFRAKKTRAGYVVCTVEAECDPAKRDPGWHHQQIRLMGYKDYRREHRLDWTSAAGDLYYPEFSNDPDRFVIPALAFVKDAPVYRGWDFGIRHPACVWFQYIQGRAQVLREVLPEQIDSYSFCKLVLYLSGQLEEAQLQRYPRAMRWANKLSNMDPTRWGEKEYLFPSPPWFPEGTRFIDYAGPEVYNPHANVEKETQERNDFEILASNGIYLGILATRVAARVAVVRKLMLPTAGGARLQISPHCRDLCAGLGGGITYKKESMNDPEPEAPAKDGYFEHLHDAFGYGIINLVSVTEELPEPLPRGPVREDSELEYNPRSNVGGFLDMGVFDDPDGEWAQ